VVVSRHSWKPNIIEPKSVPVKRNRKKLPAPEKKSVRVSKRKLPAPGKKSPVPSPASPVVRRVRGVELSQIHFSRSRIFGDLVNASPSSIVYDLGCGFCKLKLFIDNKTYVGIDIEKKVSIVVQHDLSKGLPLDLLGTPGERIAIAAGLIEYLPHAIEWIGSVLDQFDRFYFTYVQINEGMPAASKYEKTIIRQPAFVRRLSILCATMGRSLRICPLKDMPNYVPEENPRYSQDIYLIDLEALNA